MLAAPADADMGCGAAATARSARANPYPIAATSTHTATIRALADRFDDTTAIIQLPVHNNTVGVERNNSQLTLQYL